MLLQRQAISQTPNRTNERDIASLKARVNLRDVARLILGAPKRHTKKYDIYDSPLRDDGRKASFAVYEDGYKDYGGSQDGGDEIEFLMAVGNMDFHQAVESLARYAGDMPVNITRRAAQPTQTTKHEPPDTVWQNHALKALRRSQVYLWSDGALARRGRAYLHQRGLTDETIKAASIGLNPEWHDTPAGKLAPGLVIPSHYNGALWVLRVRELHQTLSRKYLNMTGSKLSGSLYGGDTVQPGQPLLIVEGELDALLAAQVLAMPVVTFGPVSNTPTKHQLDHLRQASVIYVSLDNDRTGGEAQAALCQALGSQAVPLTLPAGKDITDYVVNHNGDLAAWFEQGRVKTIPGLPDAIRTALLKYCEPTTVTGAELITAAVAMGLIDPNGFDIPTLLTVKSQVPGFDSMTESTLRRAIKFLVGLFLSELETIGGSLVSNSGRNAKCYVVRSSEDFLQAIEHQAAKRIYEEHHPVEETDSLSPILTEITPGMVKDSGFSEKPGEIALEANERLAASDWHRNDSKQAKTAAKRELARLRRSLRNQHSTPFPAGWSLGTAKDYRAAYRRALYEAQPDRTMTRREQMEALGLQNGSIKTLNANAGLAPEPHFERLPVADVVNLEARVTDFGREIRGFPKLIVAETAAGDVIQTVYHPDHARETVQSYLTQGRQVTVEYQTANTFEATSDGPPERAEPVHKPVAKPATKPSEKHYGPTYDPRWLVGQYLLGLEALGWQWVGDLLIDLDTGETVDRATPPKVLLARILDMPPPDKLLDYVAQLADVTVSGYDRATSHQGQRRLYPVSEAVLV